MPALATSAFEEPQVSRRAGRKLRYSRCFFALMEFSALEKQFVLRS
jgi:hypothetical protein